MIAVENDFRSTLDPAVYMATRFGMQMWHRQEEIVRSVESHQRTAVRSGHKVSKSRSAAAIALRWVDTHAKGEGILTSASYRQVKSVIWKEVRELFVEAQRRGYYRDARIALSPETGVRWKDGRSLVGFSTKEPERMAGNSGAERLTVIDEASGVPDNIGEAIEGNRAGGGSILMFSNPTKPDGMFYDAFHEKADFWHRIWISSEESPNVTWGREMIPGLANPDWIIEKRNEWGEESLLYQVRVRGNFPGQGDDYMIPLHLLEEALERGTDSEPTAEDLASILELGVDVARYGDDESAITCRRHLWAYPTEVSSKMDGPALAGKVLEAVRRMRRDQYEIPIVRVDNIGVGVSVYDQLNNFHRDELIPVPVDVSRKETNVDYARQRSQVWGALKAWLEAGGCLQRDKHLEKELVSAKYLIDTQGRTQVEPKEVMKKRIGRSPDRADSLGLSIFQAPMPLQSVPWSAPSIRRRM